METLTMLNAKIRKWRELREQAEETKLLFEDQLLDAKLRSQEVLDRVNNKKRLLKHKTLK